MNVVAIVHMFPPEHNAGAEYYLHALLRDVVERGDRCHVLYPNAAESLLDGITIGPLAPTLPRVVAQVADADVLVTHLDLTRKAMAVSKATGLPLVHLVHNDGQLARHGVTPDLAHLVVFNSEWLAAAQHDWPGPTLVARPHVRVADYSIAQPTPPTGMVTLINLSAAKGSRTLDRLALMEPSRRFLAVTGAYGRQDITLLRRHRNVEVVPTTPDVLRDVYARTRVLLMPSAYESWGRVAIEAACSGIPTIAAPTPGLVEALGAGGFYAVPEDVDEWRRLLRALDSPAAYEAASTYARARAREVEQATTADLDRLYGALRSLPRRSDPVSAPQRTTARGRVAVLLPFRSDNGGARDRAYEYVLDRWATLHPTFRLVVGELENGVPWHKGLALARAREQTDAETFIVADADVYLPALTIEQAVAAAVAAAVPWLWVRRWSERATRAIYTGGRSEQVERPPYRGVIGGGLVVLRAATFDATPLDPRFEGWGPEDVCWGHALRTLHGDPPPQPNVFLSHLWHPTARRRGDDLDPASGVLADRYWSANGDWQAMGVLAAEARAAMYPAGHAVPAGDAPALPIE